mmetsp:Transcript_15180/g.33213  ORF Transcript_15180/g.33213 Transcript_15180/m.33213 type:complete len:669 (-) Transcript_15180:42-2048(-)|eukprot:CAMPEP_0168737696 /NCGR_PEP_ID=MMETSP0724-20121128/10531_1 /TAXON_ID=265536 /ORGANISM="Amphiprora sp., Strain CCMP467" /LENGTH=668 /DNA_ID=CAMNT_0008784977 /DNA_START=163 /DNA_END=2169 /DNA_ORIENTATION=-
MTTTVESTSTAPTSVETQFSSHEASSSSLRSTSSKKKKKKKSSKNLEALDESNQVEPTSDKTKKTKKLSSSKKKKKDKRSATSFSESKGEGTKVAPGTLTMMEQDELPPGFTSSFQTESGVPAVHPQEDDNGEFISPEDVKGDFFAHDTNADKRNEYFENELSIAEEGGAKTRKESKEETQKSAFAPDWAKDEKQKRPNWSGKTMSCVCITIVSLAALIWLIIALRPDNDDDGGGTQELIPSQAPVTSQSPMLSPSPSPNPTPPGNIPTSPTTLAPIAPPEIGDDGRIWDYTGVRLDIPGFNNSQFAPLSMTSSSLVAGAPEDGDTGRVRVFSRSNNSFDLITVLSEPSTLSFGTAVDLKKSADGETTLIVGANAGANDEYGSAAIYSYNDRNLQMKGSTLQSATIDQDLRGGQFGHAVAVTGDGQYVAISAPSANIGAGEVYSFQFQSTSGSWLALPRIAGSVDSYFGASLDMTAVGGTFSGPSLVIGVPGLNQESSGGIRVYRYSESNVWSKITVVDAGGRAFENFGTTVKWISDDNTLFAAGGPDFHGTVRDIFGYDRGIVRAFKYNQSDDSYHQIGSDIVGESGRLIGSSLCGGNGRLGFGTAFGTCFVYEFDDESQDWVQVAGKISTSLVLPIKSCAITEDGDSIAVGMTNAQVEVFDLKDST